MENIVGGLEVRINIGGNTVREKIIESGRSAGWCPPLWYELQHGEWLNDTYDDAGTIRVGQGLSFVVKVRKLWIPNTLLAAEQIRQDVQGIQQIGCYIRYKFYDSSKYKYP